MLIAPTTNHVIWLDNEFIAWQQAKFLPTANHYGFGVFEGVRSYKTSQGPAIFCLTAHTDRLFQSAHILNLALPYTKEQINLAQQAVIQRNQLQNAYLRPMVFYDGLMGLSLHTQALKLHTLVMAFSWQQKPYEEIINPELTHGIKLQTSSFLRNHPNSILLKAKANGNYMNSILALREAQAAGANDALILDQQGFIAEASAANIFMVRNNILYTPMLTAALPGITRQCIFTLAAELGLVINERAITRDELYIADEVFLTGTAAEITPVFAVDQRKIAAGSMGPITEKLRQLFFSYVYGYRADKHGWLTYINTSTTLNQANVNALEIFN